MSELKAINAYQLTTNTEDSDVFIHNDEFGCGGDLVECYLKSEADKVIAELKDKALQYKVLDKEHCRDLNTQERFFAKQIAHNKYKRCLAMAKMCKAKYDEEDVRVNGRGASWDYTSEEMKYWERWHKHWLELAEKFKEATNGL